MSFVFTALLFFVAFMAGRASAAIEHTIKFREQLIVLIDAIIKVDQLLSFKGQSIKDLKVAEVVEKVTEHLNLKTNGN